MKPEDMPVIAFIGYGQLGRQIRRLIDACGIAYHTCYFFDDVMYEQRQANAFPFSQYHSDEFKDAWFFSGLGYQHIERKVAILEHMTNLGRHLPALIHPGVHVDPSVTIGPGCYVYPGSLLDHGVILESGVLVNNAVVISHDCVIGSGTYLSPGITFSGQVAVGKGTFVGTGVNIANGVSIGSFCRVGIGTVVTRSIPDKRSVIGNPMRLLEDDLPLT